MKRKGSILSAAFWILTPLVLGGLTALLCRDGMAQFHLLNKPPFSPPAWLFGPVWTVLYLMMGLASWRIRCSEVARDEKSAALEIYWLQLLLNLIWPLIFFRLKYYLAAMLWLGALWIAAEICLVRFYRLDHRTALLLLPYQLWLSLALYLSTGIFVLN